LRVENARPLRYVTVPSESRHRVEPLGPVRFQVEFWAREA